jgi:hypothetical protein
MVVLSASSSATQQIYKPTDEQLQETYAAIAQGAIADGSAKRLSGPPVPNAAKYAAYDATPASQRGASWKVYAINMQLYLATTPVSAGTPKTTWYAVGPMPLI